MAKGSGLGGVLKLALFLAVLYFAFTEGYPWLRKELDLGSGAGSGDAGDGAGADCVRQARRASLDFGGEIGRFIQRPRNLDAWESVAARAEDQIREAESTCRCPLESCEKASRALAELSAFVGQIDGLVRDESRAFSNPARQQERIDLLLDEAGTLALSGQ